MARNRKEGAPVPEDLSAKALEQITGGLSSQSPANAANRGAPDAPASRYTHNQTDPEFL